MTDAQELQERIEVPKNTGIEGFLETIRVILRKPKVVELRIDTRGVILCRRYVSSADDRIEVNFEEYEPANVVRNTQVAELQLPPGYGAPAAIAGMFDIVASAQLKPLAFVSGASTTFWAWHASTAGFVLQNRATLYGLPFYADRRTPDTALILVAGYGLDSTMADARNSYKLEIPYSGVPTDTVDF